jgi:hypothetical protein
MSQKSRFFFAGLVILFAFEILELHVVSEWIIMKVSAQTNATAQLNKNIKMVVNWTDHTVRIVNLSNNETISIRNFTFSPGGPENATGNITSPQVK